MTRNYCVIILFLGLVSLPAVSFARGDEAPFQAGVPLEVAGGSYYQNGVPIDRETMEVALSQGGPESRTLMAGALRKRTGGRVCLGIGIPLLIGGVATSVVASSGTVGSGTGTIAVYGVSIGLLVASLALDVTALVLLVKSRRHYSRAVEEYNTTLGGATSARDIRLRVSGSGLLLSVGF